MSEILPYLQANKLAHYSVMNTSRKHKTTWSKTKTLLLIHNTAITMSISIFTVSSPCPLSFTDEPRWMLLHASTHYRTGILTLGTHIFYNRQLLYFSLWEKIILFSKAVHYTNILEKIVGNKRCQCLCLQDLQNHERAKNYLPILLGSGL